MVVYGPNDRRFGALFLEEKLPNFLRNVPPSPKETFNILRFLDGRKRGHAGVRRVESTTLLTTWALYGKAVQIVQLETQSLLS